MCVGQRAGQLDLHHGWIGQMDLHYKEVGEYVATGSIPRGNEAAVFTLRGEDVQFRRGKPGV